MPNVISNTVYERHAKVGVIECGLSDHHFVFIIMYKNNTFQAKTGRVKDYKYFINILINEVDSISDLRCAMFERNRRWRALWKSVKSMPH